MKHRLPLHFRILIGMVAGVAWAVLSSYMGWSRFNLHWIDPFGVIFINLLKLIAVPLVLFSIISGVAGMGEVTRLGKLGVRTLALYLVTTVIAVGVGLFVVNMLRPGDWGDPEKRIGNRINYELWVQETEGVAAPLDGKCLSCEPRYHALRDSIAEVRGSAVPNEWSLADRQASEKVKEVGPLQFLVDIVPSNIFLSFNNTLMLQVIFFAVFFGIMLLLIPPGRAGPVNDLMNGCNEVFMKMVEVVMLAAPYFVFALMTGVVARMAGDDLGSVVELFKGLAGYSITVVLGLAFVVFMIYPALMTLLMRRNVYVRFLRAMSPAQLLAFSTSSSAATLPATIKCVEGNIGVSKPTASFVLPIGATVNMDGTSLLQAVAVVFLAQLHMVDLTFGQQLSIVLTATLASIGAAAIPSAGLMLLVVVLSSLGLDPAWVAIVFTVDRPLDMFRTVVNVTGDATVCSVVAHVQGEKLFTDEA
ncbi:MAG: dicarboxylate/amino acid:cation symporter [Flavobacteriales bacterium]|nr:dicarboxylate/amino acid:cation symporter [Flavobacteriales bacterium]